VTLLRQICRSLLRTPTHTVAALLTLALGIGVNTSMFSLLDVLLFRRAPFPQPEQLVRIFGTSPQNRYEGFAFAEIEEMRAQSGLLQSLTAYASWENTLSEAGRPAERLEGIDATEEFFRTAGVQPALGRVYSPDEEVPGRGQVALLSHALWQSRFAGDPGIVGRSIRLNSEPVTVIGVMPPTFTYPLLWGRVDLWRPVTIPPFITNDRNNRFYQVMARMKPGVTTAQVVAELTPLAARWARDYPQTCTGRGFRVMPLHESTEDDTSRSFIWLLAGLAGFVLLIACANLANLELARCAASTRDLAIRSALGASRSRLVLYQLADCIGLALVGGGLGVLLAMWVNQAIGNHLMIGTATGVALPVDGRVLAAALGISLLTGLLFGILPAVIASRADVSTALKQQSRGSTSDRSQHRMRHALIAAEVALALILLSGASVMLRGFRAFVRQDNGWDTDRVLVAGIHLPEQSTYLTEEQRWGAIQKLQRRLDEIPGTERCAISSTLPLFGYYPTKEIEIEGQPAPDPEHRPTAGWAMVTPSFLPTIGVPLVEGRMFPVDFKREGPPYILVNESLARHFWPGQSALGRRIASKEGEKYVWREIIGVVRDVKYACNPGRPDTPFQIYKPLAHEPWGALILTVRSPHPDQFRNQLRRAVADVDPDVAVQEVYTFSEFNQQAQHNLVLVNQILGGFAVLGLALAAVGLFGVISNIVAQRIGEFGIRIALGASRRDILRLVMAKGVLLTALGLAIGVIGSYGLNLILGSLMPRVAATDPWSLVNTALLLLAVALLACWLPARRATKVDPMTALRAE